MQNMQNIDLSLLKDYSTYYFTYIFAYSAYILLHILHISMHILHIRHIMKWIRRNNPVAFVHWLCSTRTRQAGTTSGPGLHQGSSHITHNCTEPIGRTLDPRGDATLVWPVVPNPCLPANNEIVGSMMQLVLIPDIFSLDAPIVLSQVLQILKKRVSLLDARE